MTIKAKILIVDDREENLLAASAVLDSLKVDIFEAQSGERALRLLLEHDFAVVLLDVEMPGTDGFATAQMIRNRQKSRHTPIIFLTAVDRGQGASQQGYALGAVDYIIKPFDPEILRWKVSVFCELYVKSAQAQELAREQASRKEWEAAAKRSTLLADVTSTLVSSMNYAATLDRLAELVVPAFADWARVLGVTAESGGPVTLNEADPEFFRNMGVEDQGPGSILTIPIRGQTGPIASLIMFRAAPNAYTATDRLMAEDLADRASLAITNAQLFEEAQAANRAKDQFLAVVSHELRTPLNAIAGWVQILRSKELDPELRKKAFQTIQQNAKLQDELIGDILDISRIVAGQLSVAFEDVQLDDLVRTTLDALKPTADAKGVQMSADVPPHTPTVAGDPKRLQQVLWNLVANAIKFTPKGGVVEVEIEATSSHICVRVRDTGPGIKPELLNRIFEPFIQGESSLKRSYGGLGLGLAITRHLVELHGGSVKAESPGQGKGSLFTVRLPLRHADQRAS